MRTMLIHCAKMRMQNIQRDVLLILFEMITLLSTSFNLRSLMLMNMNRNEFEIDWIYQNSENVSAYLKKEDENYYNCQSETDLFLAESNHSTE